MQERQNSMRCLDYNGPAAQIEGQEPPEIKLENDYLAILMNFPEKIIESALDPKHFANMSNRAVFKFIQEHWKECKDGFVPLQLMQDETLKVWATELSARFNVIVGNQDESFGSIEAELIEAWKRKEILNLAFRLQNRQLSLEDYEGQINDLLHESLPEEHQESYEERLKRSITKGQTLRFGPNFAYFQSIAKLKEGRFYVIGAHTGTGKTAFGLNLAMDLVQNGYKILYFNTEMQQEDMDNRLWAAASNQDIGVFEDRIDREDDFDPNDPVIAKTLQSLQRYPEDRFVFMQGSKTAAKVKTEILRRSKNGVRPIVIIDHLQRLTVPKGETEYTCYTNTARMFNDLVKDGKCTIFLLSQVNKESLIHCNVNSLKGSNAPAEEADCLFFVEYAATDEKEWEEMKLDPICAPIRLNIAKNRGAQAQVPFIFDKKRQKFLACNIDDLADPRDFLRRKSEKGRYIPESRKKKA